MLNKLVENAHEAAYYRMIAGTEMQDAKEEWIEERADEVMRNFGNDNDSQIVEYINKKLDNNYVNADIYNQFITDICWSQAKDEYEKKFRGSL